MFHGKRLHAKRQNADASFKIGSLCQVSSNLKHFSCALISNNIPDFKSEFKGRILNGTVVSLDPWSQGACSAKEVQCKIQLRANEQNTLMHSAHLPICPLEKLF